MPLSSGSRVAVMLRVLSSLLRHPPHNYRCVRFEDELNGSKACTHVRLVEKSIENCGRVSSHWNPIEIGSRYTASTLHRCSTKQRHTRRIEKTQSQHQIGE